jgi:capsular exopolysaccharide synthesis family protein
MAKTYEAMIKAESSDDDFSHFPPPDSRFLDFGDIKQTGDLYRKIANLRKKSEVFNFVSSREGEGVSTIVNNLVNYMLRRKYANNILLIDANLHNSVLHARFNHTQEKSLEEISYKTYSCSEAIREIKPDNFNLLPSGGPRHNLLPDVEQNIFHKFISDIQSDYDFIFIDSPPLLISTGALSIAVSSSVTFLVTDAHRTRAEVAKKAKQILQENGCTIGGVILNRVKHPIPEWLYKRL